MPPSGSILFGVLALLAEAILFSILNEVRDATHLRLWLIWQWRSITAWLAVVPNPKSRRKHKALAFGLIATAVFALGALGYSMLDAHPCGAWAWWTIALVCAAYSLWQLTPIPRWARIAIIVMAISVFGFYGQRSIYSETELNFFFVNPGIFLIGGTGDWLLSVSGQNTHKSLFHVEMVLQDVVTANAVAREPDMVRRSAMIQGDTVYKTYPEIGPTFLGDQIQWRPIDVNNQEYSVRATYRIGEKSFLSTEEIRIVNVGTRFPPPDGHIDDTAISKINWQMSVTVRNETGEVLMHCVDKNFIRDSRWRDGHPCFPGAHYEALPRSLCQRCFGHGFEFIPTLEHTE
jgi:hypothetical protein